MPLGDFILSLTIGRHNPSCRSLWKAGRESEAFERPPCVLGKDGVARFGELRKPRADFPVARLARAQTGISDGDARVAHEAAPLGALHRAPAKHLAKLSFAQGEQPFEIGSAERMFSTLPGLEIGRRGHRRAPIPRANVLADVAPEDVPPDRFAQLRRNRSAEFDGQIRDATPRVENVRLDDRAGRARVDTQAAVAAQVRDRRVGGANRSRQVQRGDDHAEEKPRANFLVYQTRILREPAEPGVFGGDALDNRSRIHIGSC